MKPFAELFLAAEYCFTVHMGDGRQVLLQAIAVKLYAGACAPLHVHVS